jgi:23S rRNA pseudouridine2604 synthase
MKKPKQTLRKPDAPTPLTFPMRINRFLAFKNYATRKGADVLIEKGQVTINGRRAQLGDKVKETDDVKVKNATKKDYVYLAYNKPHGIVTHSAQSYEEDIKKIIGRSDVFPIGRLDKDSDGLIILTNDGRVTDKLLNPNKVHEKEYEVTTKFKLRPNFKEKMEAGVQIENEKTRPCKIKITGDNKFYITLTEGKRHQIRRMCVALFNEVNTLKRVRIMNILLGKLKANEYRTIEGAELKTFLEKIF